MKLLKNLKISSKLIFGFSSLIAITLLVGLVGIFAMNKLSTADKRLYKDSIEPMGALAIMYDTLATQRINISNMVIFVQADPQFSKDETESLKEKEQLFEEALQKYGKALINKDEIAVYDSINDLYFGQFSILKQNLRDAVTSGDSAVMAATVLEIDGMGGDISGYLDEAFALKDLHSVELIDDNQAISFNSTLLLIIAMAAGIAIALIFAMLISGMISKPVNLVKDILLMIGQKGKLKFSDDQHSAIREYSQGLDEVSQSLSALEKMCNRMNDVSSDLSRIADGDLTMRVTPISPDDTMGLALEKMVNILNTTFAEISNTSNIVAQSSKEATENSLGLAQGATQQTAAVSSLVISISEVSTKTKGSSEMALETAKLGDSIMSNAEIGSKQMQDMMDAVKQITEASASIGKVIKVIDDIAFQTNILALNAAVEAARAGQHGKGFAVVAEEVRNLAAKSAQAASETGVLIANSIEKADLGAKIAEKTSASLSEIVKGITESSSLINQIARSSQEQADAINNIKNGVREVGEVVGLISKGAETSSNAADTMRAQSDALYNYVSEFKLSDNTEHRPQLNSYNNY